MKIIALDLAGICRRFHELDKTGSLSDGSALSASLQYITRAVDGFDRVVVACDVRPSFRKALCPTYKAGREAPGPVYDKLEADVAQRLFLDGAAVFPNKGEREKIRFGGGYPEADDVIASLAHWYAPKAGEGWSLTIASEDSDMCALVSAEQAITVRRFDGSTWQEKDVTSKFDCGPESIRDVKALAGDEADGYRPFPHHDPPVEGGKTKPGIGWKKAVALLSAWGKYRPEVELPPAARVLLAAQDGEAGIESGMNESHERRCLLAGGKAALDMGYACATMLNVLELGFDRILAEPVKRSLTPEKAPAEAPKDHTDVSIPAPMVVHEAKAADRPRRDRNQIERHALQPRNWDSLVDVAKMLFDARMFPAFDCWQGVAGAIIISAEQGIGLGQALRGTYVVKGKHAYSAALIVALVKRERSCKLFRLDQSRSNDKRATVKFWHADDDAPSEYTFTWEMAVTMGVTTGRRPGAEKTKWETQPHLMLAWAAMRECARLHWPEVVAGMYTPDELRASRDLEDAEVEQTAGDMPGEVVS